MHGSTSATRELRVIWKSPRKEKGTTGLVRQRCWINSCVRHRTTTLEERPTLTSRMIALKPRTLPPGRTPKGGLHLILTLWFAARIRAAQCADPVSSTPRSLYQESRRSDVRDPERSSRLCGSGPSTSDLRDLPNDCLNLHETLPQCTVPRQSRASRAVMSGHQRTARNCLLQALPGSS